MSYAPVASASMLWSLKFHKLLPNYLLLLAHDVIAYPAMYREITNDFNGEIILDNSLIELGKPMQGSDMLKALDILKGNVTYVVLPDILMDAIGTLTEIDKALVSWVPMIDPRIGLMVATQGKSVEALYDFAIIAREKVLEQKRKIKFGIPRILTNKGIPRTQVVNKLQKLDVPMHLLGMSDMLADDMYCFSYRGVTGIDSATPIRLGFEGQLRQSLLYSL